MARRNTKRVRFLRGTDRGGRRYEPGEVARVDWRNLPDLVGWGVLEMLPDAEEVTDGDTRQVGQVL